MKNSGSSEGQSESNLLQAEPNKVAGEGSSAITGTSWRQTGKHAMKTRTERTFTPSQVKFAAEKKKFKF